MTRWFLKSGRRRAAIISCVILSFLLVSASLLIRSKSTNTDPVSASLDTGDGDDPGSGVAEALRGNIKKILLLDGELRAVSSRTIFSSTQEEVKITYLPAEGSLVRAGDRVVELDNSTVLGRIKDIEERIVASENDIVKTSSLHEAALRDMDVALSKLWLTYEQTKLDAKVPAAVVARRIFQENQLAFEKARTEYENQLASMQSLNICQQFFQP